jgi:dipeptidyl aminopeptidase/acylaminoacyl peptidase
MACLFGSRTADRPMCALRASVAAITFAVLVSAVFSPVQAAPLEVYGRLPVIENLALSPDGSRVAFVKTEGNNRFIAVYSLANHAIVSGARAGEQKVRYIQWADNDHLLIVTSMTTLPFGFVGSQDEWYQMQVYDLKKHHLFLIPNRDTFQDVDLMNVIAGRAMVRHLNDHTVVFVPGVQKTSGLALALIRVDLETQATRVVRAGSDWDTHWVVDDAGNIAAEQTYHDRDGQWRIVIRSDGRLREAAAGKADIDVPRLLGWGPTADTLLLQRLEDGDPVWRLLSLKDGSIGPPMAGEKYLNEPIEDGLTNRMIGGVHVGDWDEYVFFDPPLQRAWELILGSFPDEHLRFESATAEFRKVIVQIEGAKHGFVYYLIDTDAHQGSSLGAVYQGLTRPLEVRPISYTAADGTRIPAYLTLPEGKRPEKLPLIVLPHGGPAVRDTAEFDWWSQALAAQGYAVLRPNYRGSAVSRDFMSKGFGEWGRKMQTDLSDGVRYLAREGIADPGRVCIVGASYGGYAALAGASLDPGVYRCAVAVAGISDIRRMLEWVNDEHHSRNNRTQRYWDRFMGVSGPKDPAVSTISPINHLDAITVPVLLIHGKDDTVVPYEQSQVMYDALRRKGKDVQFVTLKDEDHWLSRSGTRLQMLEASVAFLRAHNPPE